MAYVVSVTTFTENAASSPFVVPIQPSLTDDIVLIATTYEGAVPTPTNCSIDASATTGDRLYLMTLKQPGSPYTTESLSHTGTRNISGFCIVIRGANTTTWVDPTGASAAASGTGTTWDAPAVTPTNTDTLVFHFCSFNNGARTGYIEPGYMPIGGSGPGTSQGGIVGGYTYQRTAATTGTCTFYGTGDPGSANQSVGTIAIVGDGSTGIKGYVDRSSDANKPAGVVAFPGIGMLSGPLCTTVSDPTTAWSESLNGITTRYTGEVGCGIGSSSGGIFQLGAPAPNLRSTSTSIAGDMYLLQMDMTTMPDLTDEIVVFTNKHTGTQTIQGHEFPHMTLGWGDGTNYIAYAVGGSDALPNVQQGAFPTLIQLETSGAVRQGYELDEVGTFDPSTITKMLFGICPVTSNQDSYMSPVYTLNTMRILGGSTNHPVSFSTTKKASESGFVNTIHTQGGQTAGQFFCAHKVQFGDGGTTGVVIDCSNQSAEWPLAASTSVVPIRGQAQIASARLGCVYDPGAVSYTVGPGVFTMGDFHVFELLSGTPDMNGRLVSKATVTLSGLAAAIGGATFTGCKGITALDDCSAGSGCTFDASADTNCITISDSTEAALQTKISYLDNCTLSNNTVGLKIEYTGSGNIALTISNMTWTSNTKDIHYSATTQAGSVLTLTNDDASYTPTTSVEDDETLTVVSPTVSLTVNSSEASSDIVIFNTGTQTIEASATGTTASTTTAATYDWTVMKAGFIPQRGTAVVLGSESVTVDVTLVEDLVYNSSHGLTFTTDYSYDANTRIMTIVANQEGRDLYSAMIDDFISESALDNCPFPLTAIGPDRIDFNAVGYYNSGTTVGATIDSGDITFWKGAGMEWEHDTTGNPTKKFYSIKSANTLQSGSVVGYTQVNTGTPVEATLVSDKVNQVIQYFEDTNGDGSADNDYTGHLLFKGFKTGYYQARWDVINDSGVASLEPYEYTINLLQDAIAGTTGDQSITIATLTDHTSSPLVVGSKNFDYELVDPATSAAGDLLAQLNYDVFTAVDADITGSIYTSYPAFELPDMVVEAGSTFETEYGYFEGDGLVTDLSGVYLSQSSLDHPGIGKFQSNDGTYYTPAVTADITVSGMPTTGANIRLQIHNDTAKTASAWAAATAYSLGDKVLRSTGLGTEQTGGLYMVCTTAGTSHATTEPTWDTTVGNTTADNTVTWTTYAIIYYDADPSSASLADTYTNLEEFATGDTYSYRFAEMDGATSFKIASGTGLVASTGFSFAVSVTADAVYASNAVDGSATAVTNIFTANYTSDYIVLDANLDFTLPKAFAFYCYELTVSEGMYNFWGGVSAIDAGNYYNDVTVVDIVFDENTGDFVKQEDSDNSRWYRSDGARPYRDPTTGSGGTIGGIAMNWKNPVYTISTGSVLTAGQQTELTAAAGAAASVFSTVTENSETYAETVRLIRAAALGKAAVSGSTVTFRDAADSKDRITSTTDTDGQRTNITTDGS